MKLTGKRIMKRHSFAPFAMQRYLCVAPTLFSVHNLPFLSLNPISFRTDFLYCKFLHSLFLLYQFIKYTCWHVPKKWTKTAGCSIPDPKSWGIKKYYCSFFLSARYTQYVIMCSAIAISKLHGSNFNATKFSFKRSKCLLYRFSWLCNTLLMIYSSHFC